MATPAISVEALQKSFDGVEAVRGVTFSVPPGQVCGYLGPNGAGKTTTIKMLAGILKPTAGEVAIGGHTQPSLAAKRMLGYLPEGGGLYGLLTAREQLNLIADLYELDPAEAEERGSTLLELFDVHKLVNRRIDSLSKGQRQKVAITATLLHDPQVVLLDEPLNGLDANAARALKDVITGLAARGRTILYCSHILDVVERLCERAIIIHEGVIVADAPTADLVARGKEKTLEGVFTQLTRAADVDELAGAFLDAVDKTPKGKKKKKKKK